MNNCDLELILKYPLISCEILNNEKHYKGKILSSSGDINLHVVANSHFQLQTTFNEKIDAKVRHITSENITEFLDKVVAVLNEEKVSLENQSPLRLKVLEDFSEFDRFYLIVKKSIISADLSLITIATLDEGGREHLFTIQVDWNNAKDMYCPQVDLPEVLANTFPERLANFSELYTDFIKCVEALQPFYDVMDYLDRNACILDPERPTRRDCHRRIWLNEHLSVLVIVNPLSVTVRPEIKFLGPERIIDEHREKTKKNWDESVDFIQGFLHLLELEDFPQRLENSKNFLMNEGECSICFSLRLNDKLPEVICSNKSCENYYHTECLFEWLISVNSKRIFNRIHGQCPNCEKTISCSIPEDSHKILY